ncbi:hypothetical protein FGG08_006658 [Glutinoglossum americanum]|uniref:Uncharacterized protein n=1 Tax=Glutinoglossum americanum TaxID=1670608 RepID=A0A9P8HVL1_9PEZI|nr:hypothetical protein FGG08_006658 [Glutinoglossum americanum]
MSSFFAVVVLSLLLTVSAESSQGQHIDFSHFQFPEPQTELPVFSLGPSVQFPWAAVKDIVLATAKKQEDFKEVDIGNGTALVSDDRVAARLDRATGETIVFPRLSDLKPGSQFSFDAAKEYLDQGSVFPPDDTQISPVQGQSIFNAAIDRSGNQMNVTKPGVFLSNIYVQRNITAGAAQYSVCGPGSKGSFTVDSTGKVVSVSHRWRSAKKSGSGLKALPKSNIQDAILTQLAKAQIANATVDNLELCYYDSGKSYIQPVYRFLATPGTTLAGIDVQRIVGYVPAVEGPPEQVPDLIRTEGASNPGQAPLSGSQSGPSNLRRQSGAPVGFVRYIMQNDDNVPLWLQDSQDFLNGLNIGSAMANFFCVLGLKFCSGLDNEQYFWSEQRFFTNENDFFVDSAPLAYQENHGSNHFFCTDTNAQGCGGVSITSIPSSGYGDGQNRLRYWINRACSFIPGPADMDIVKAADPWWNVFDGLHVALGFRVTSWCRDGTTFPIGLNAALGVGMVSSWMSTVNDAAWYQGLPHGAASAIAVCGHSDDTLYDRQDIGRANCLEFWYVS